MTVIANFHCSGPASPSGDESESYEINVCTVTGGPLNSAFGLMSNPQKLHTDFLPMKPGGLKKLDVSGA